MRKSNINQFIIKIKFGKRYKYGLNPYNYKDALSAKKRLISVGINPNRISIIPYKSAFL